MEKTRSAGKCFFTFLKCSQMKEVFSYSLIHSLGSSFVFEFDEGERILLFALLAGSGLNLSEQSW